MATKMLPNTWVRATLWLLLRVWVGFQFLDAGVAKLFGDEKAAFIGANAGAGIKGMLTGATSVQMTGGAHPAVLAPFVWLAQNVFIPAAPAFSYMVAFGEVLIGLALLVGLFTRFAAFWGAFLNLLFMLAGSSGVNPYMFTIELSILLVGVSAGLLGADAVVLPYVKAEYAKWRAGTLSTPLHLPRGGAPRPVH